MKKLTLVIAAALVCAVASAQVGKNKLGFNAGAGVEVPLTECIAIFAECKYQFGGKEYNNLYKQFVPSIGVTFAL